MLQERDDIPAFTTIADKKPKEIYAKLSDVTAAMDKGTLTTLFEAPKPSLKLQSRTKPTNKKSTSSLSNNSGSAFHLMCSYMLKAS